MGITVEIDGIGRVQLDDSFSSLSPERQNEVISGIVASIKPANDPQQAMRDRIAAAKAGTLQMDPRTPDPAAANQIAEDQMTLSAVPAWLQATTKFAQGVPFVGEYSDELTGMVSQKAGDMQRAVQGAMDREYPKTSLGLQIAGGITGTAATLGATGLGAKGAEFVGRGSTLATRALRGAAIAAPGGVLEGAAAASGAANPGERLQAAGRGAMVGGALSVAIGAFAPALGQGVTELAKRIKKLDVSTIANEFGLSAPAARVVRRYLLADDLDAAANVLARGGDDAMLGNAGPSTRQALDTAASTGGQALSIARTRVGNAVNDASKRFLGAVDDILGTAEGGIKGAAKAISRGTAAARKTAYDLAYAQPTPMAGEAGQKLQGVLARIAPEDMQATLREANAEMLDKGYRNQNIMASIGPDGSVTFSQPLSVLQLDYIARGLSNIVEKGTDTLTGALSPAAQRAQGQMRDLRAVMKESVPGYANALKVGGDAARAREALATGRKLLSDSASVEDIRMFVREGVSEEAKAALRKGLRENLDAIMGRARTTIADLESGAVDFAAGQNAAAEAVAAVRNVLTRNNMMKARYVLGGDASRLFGELEKMADVLVLRAAVARGSATAIRAAGQQQMREEVAPGIFRSVVGNIGNPFDAARELSRGAVGIDARSIGEREAAYYAEIADALTRIRGPEAQRALVAVKNAMAGQPMKDADAALIGRALSGSAAIGAYQTGSQSLTPQ